MDEALKNVIDDVGAKVDAATGAGGGSEKPEGQDKPATHDETAEGEPTPEKVYDEVAADPEKGPVLKEMEAVAGGKAIIMEMLKRMHEPNDDMKALMSGRLDAFKERKPKDGTGIAAIFAEPGIAKGK